MRSYWFIVVLNLMTLIGLGQKDTTKPTIPMQFEFAKPKMLVPISVSYFGNMIVHPGVKIGADYTLLYIQKNKEKKKKIKVIGKMLYAQPNLSFYVHPKSHSALQTNLELGWRRINRILYTEYSLSMGYMRRFNIGETYVTDAEGNVTDIKNGTSRGYFTTGLSAGIGKNIRIRNNQYFALFTRLNALLITGYNAGVAVDASWEMGIKFNLGNTFAHSRYKYISK
jgi:hypothetical protein